MTEDAFVKGMAIIQEAFPSKRINSKIYFEALKDLEDEKFLDSVALIVRKTTKLYPDDNLIAMILENVTGSLESRAVLAWAQVKSAIMSHGYYKTVCFADRVINGAIEAMGGWEKVSSMLIEDEPFRAKDFVKLYEAIEKSGRACPDKLVGYIERTNGTEEKVNLIGFERRKIGVAA